MCTDDDMRVNELAADLLGSQSFYLISSLLPFSTLSFVYAISYFTRHVLRT